MHQQTATAANGFIWSLVALALTCGLATLAQAQVTEPTHRGWMGLYIRNLDAQDLSALGLAADQQGVVVSGVDEEGPAAAVGIEPGDVITSLDGKPLAWRSDFLALLADRRAGDRIRMQVIRSRTSRSIEFQLQARPREMQGAPASTPAVSASAATRSLASPHLICLDLGDRDLADYFGISAGDGVLVLEANGEGVEQFRAGDVITEVNDTSIRSVADLRRLWHSASDATQTHVRIIRSRRSRQIRLSAESRSAVQIAETLPAAAADSEPAWAMLRQEIDQLRQRLLELEAQVDAQVHR